MFAITFGFFMLNSFSLRIASFSKGFSPASGRQMYALSLPSGTVYATQTLISSVVSLSSSSEEKPERAVEHSPCFDCRH